MIFFRSMNRDVLMPSIYLRLPLISFISILLVSVYTSFANLVKFILVFYFLDMVVNEIILLIFFSDYLFLVYGSATDFCLLILQPETLLNLLNLFISSNKFYFILFAYNLQSFPHIRLCCLQIEIILLLLFELVRLLFFSCLTVLGRTYSTMQNRGKCGHTCLVPILEEELSVFHH